MMYEVHTTNTCLLTSDEFHVFDIMSSRSLSIQTFSPDDLARQMTILDNELFQKVDVSCVFLTLLYCQEEIKLSRFEPFFT